MPLTLYGRITAPWARALRAYRSPWCSFRSRGRGSINSLGNNILQLSGSEGEEGGAYIGLRSGKDDNEIVVQMGTNRQTTDDGSIDYKGYIKIPN